jgi:putative peptidoglycan lipid II flippase
VALIILATPILMTLFQYDKLTVGDVGMAAMSLQAYSLGLLAFMLIKVLAPGYFSQLDTKTPVTIGIKAMVANMMMNVIFVVPLHYFWQIGHVGLALATSLAAVLNAALLYRGLRLKQVYAPMPGFAATLLRMTMAAMAMALVLAMLLPEPPLWENWQWLDRLINLLWLCAAGVVTYFSALFVSGGRPRDFKAASNTQG